MILPLAATDKRTEAGFTLVELMVVIVVIAIIAGLSFAEINTDSYRLKSAAKILAGNLQRARLEAVKRNLDVSLKFDRDNDGNADHGYDIIDAANNTILSLTHDRITYGPSMMSLTFTPLGTCSAGHVTLVITGTTAPEYTVTFNNLGRINFAKTK